MYEPVSKAPTSIVSPTKPAKLWWNKPPVTKKGKGLTLELKRNQVKFAKKVEETEAEKQRKEKLAKIERLKFSKNLDNAPITKGQKEAAARVLQRTNANKIKMVP